MNVTHAMDLTVIPLIMMKRWYAAMTRDMRVGYVNITIRYTLTLTLIHWNVDKLEVL